MFDDIELDPTVAVLTVGLGSIGIAIIWLSSMWEFIPVGTKLIITIAAYPLIYFVLLKALNKY